VAQRFCSNCRAELPLNAEACPACGVFAGELYDERMHRPKTRFKLFAGWLVIALLAGGAAVWFNAQRSLPDRKQTVRQTPRTRVVGDRPGGARRAAGAKISEAEAIRLVRRHLVTTNGIRNDCIVLLGAGFSGGGYVVNARDHCTSTRLGKWRVDAKTGAVTKAL
jgi:hypothetical protein